MVGGEREGQGGLGLRSEEEIGERGLGLQSDEGMVEGIVLQSEEEIEVGLGLRSEEEVEQRQSSGLQVFIEARYTKRQYIIAGTVQG